MRSSVAVTGLCFVFFFWVCVFVYASFLLQTDAFQKPVPLEQHPDYAEYIFHPMDLCTLEKVGFHQRAHSCRDDSRVPSLPTPCLKLNGPCVSPLPLLFGWKNALSPNFFVTFSQGLQWVLKPAA